GLNSAGLGLAINGITSTRDGWGTLNSPFHLRCYHILRSHDIEAAAAVITATPRACSANYLLAQPPAQVLDVEAAPHAVHRLTWNDGIVIHANHFIAPESAGIEEPPNPYRPMSCRRSDRLHELIRRNLPASIEDLQRYLQDHGQPQRASICRHHNPADPPAEQYRTVTSVVMDLDERTIYLTDGPPCQNDYKRYSL
ncbi:MAG TPA: C45 family peptidase, partial [Anaerolineae bacterium]